MSRNAYGALVLVLSAAVFLSACPSTFGQGWSVPVAIDSGIYNNAQVPRVALGPDGRALAAFTEFSEIDENYCDPRCSSVADRCRQREPGGTETLEL